MANVFSLVGNIFIESDKAENAINAITKKGKDADKSLGSSFKNMAKSAAVFTAAAAGAAVAVGTAAFGIAKSFSDTASAISDNSKMVGMSAEEYQKWVYAGKQSGIAQEKLLTLLKKQQTTFADATQGVKGASKAYKDLGIDISKLNGEQALKAVLLKLADMEDETLRNAIANDIFGKSYSDLLPLLGEGADGIMSLYDELEALGGLISNESVESGDKFGDTLERIDTIMKGVWYDLGEVLLPYFQQFADWIVNNKDEIKKFADGAMSTLKDVLGKVGDFLSKIVDQDGDATDAFGNIVWFFGAITAAPLIAALASHPILAMVSAIATLITFKDQIGDIYNALNPSQKLIANLTSLALVIGGVVVAMTGGAAGLGIAAGMAALGLAMATVIGSAEAKARGASSSQGKVDLTKEMTTGARAYVGTETNGYSIASTGSKGGEDISDKIAQAVKDALKNVDVKLDDKKVGNFVDKRLLMATE